MISMGVIVTWVSGLLLDNPLFFCCCYLVGGESGGGFYLGSVGLIFCCMDTSYTGP